MKMMKKKRQKLMMVSLKSEEMREIYDVMICHLHCNICLTIYHVISQSTISSEIGYDDFDYSRRGDDDMVDGGRDNDMVDGER